MARLMCPMIIGIATIEFFRIPSRDQRSHRTIPSRMRSCAVVSIPYGVIFSTAIERGNQTDQTPPTARGARSAQARTGSRQSFETWRAAISDSGARYAPKLTAANRTPERRVGSGLTRSYPVRARAIYPAFRSRSKA